MTLESYTQDPLVGQRRLLSTSISSHAVQRYLATAFKANPFLGLFELKISDRCAVDGKAKDADFVFSYVNDRYKALLGAEGKNFANQPLSKYFPSNEVAGVDSNLKR